MNNPFIRWLDYADGLEREVARVRALLKSASIVSVALRNAGFADVALPIISDECLSASWRLRPNVLLGVNGGRPNLLLCSIYDGPMLIASQTSTIDEKFTVPTPVLAALRGAM